MKIRTAYFPIGSSYYPPYHTPAEWEHDLANMARAGLRQIRTAEMLTSWDYIEPRRGHPEWDWLDRLFELADLHDIDILLGTGSCNPPIWMIEYYPDLQRVSRENIPYPTNTVWGWACMNNPGYRNEIARYLSLLIKRYGTHPRLFAWQIDNQLGFHSAYSKKVSASIETPGASRENAYYCYCDHCARLFRGYVETKYGHIEALNEAWSWDPTHYRYYSWHQIDPPRSMPAEWGNGTAWLDFRRFIRDSFSSFIRFQHDLIKTADTRHLTMHNLYNCLRPDMGAIREPDHWQIAGIVDISGHDHYPSEHNFKEDPSYTSWFYDFAYSVARHNDRTFWVPELESGPIGRYSAGPRYATNALDIKRFVMEAIGHGAKQVLYMAYRDWNCIPLTWGGLVDFHGTPNDRYAMASKINEMIREHQNFFLDSLPAPAEIGLLHSHENAIVLDGQANEDFLYRALRGAHMALWNQGFPLEFVAPQFLNTPSAQYKVMLLPFLMHLPQETADRLTVFVENGGAVIGFAKLGHMDGRGWAWNDRPGAGLTTLFGARETHLETFEQSEPALHLRVEPDHPLFEGIEQDSIPGYWHRQTFELAPDVEVLARFIDGEPAVIRREQGGGQAILIATHLDIAFWEHREPALERLFANLMQMCGVRRPIVLEGDDQTYLNERVDAHLLRHGNQQAIIINNNGNRDVEFTVKVPVAKAATESTQLFGGSAFGRPDAMGRYPLRLVAWDCAVCLIQPSNGS